MKRSLKLSVTLQPANIDDMLKPINFLLIEAAIAENHNCLDELSATRYAERRIIAKQMNYKNSRNYPF